MGARDAAQTRGVGDATTLIGAELFSQNIHCPIQCIPLLKGQLFCLIKIGKMGKHFQALLLYILLMLLLHGLSWAHERIGLITGMPLLFTSVGPKK